MPLDITALLHPMFAVLTALVAVPAAVFAAVAVRRRGGRTAARRDDVRMEVRPAGAAPHARARSA